MSFFNQILSKLFGTKSERDIKEIMPYVEKIKEEYEKLRNLSHDELRQLSHELKTKIRDHYRAEQEEIDRLKARIDDPDIEIEEKERLFEETERLEKLIDKKVNEILDESLPLAFAIVKETAYRFANNEKIVVTATEFDRYLATVRPHVVIEGDHAVWHNRWMAGGSMITWDMTPYDVQLIGGVVLHQGKVAEMATGEGKTLVATLPVFLNALAGRGVHVVTVNDYLARRDSEWMGPIYEFHGLSVDCIDKHQPNSEARRKAYQADITYGTNNEFGFDYLRDNMAISPDDLVQRQHIYAIVDEVDSVLIDDARTPLIISGPVPRGEEQEFETYRPKVETLVNAQRKLVTQVLADARKAWEEGDKEKAGLLTLRAHKGLPKYKPLIKFLSEEGVKAQMLKTENFYMQENNKNMHIVTDELFFIIDEKNNAVELTEKGIELITSSSEDPGFFVLPDVGSEIANIEKENIPPAEKIAKKDKLLQEYAIKADRVHTVHQLLKAYALFEKDVEYIVQDNKVKIVDEQTGRILEGRRYSDGLHQAIEAKERVKVEAATQTHATITLQNYFRMYKKLAGMTGTAETEAAEFWNIYKLDVVVIPTNKPCIRKDYDDLVYKSKREKYNAVIEEIVRLVEAGRPVLVGTTSVEISELLSRMLTLRKIKHNVLNAKHHQREAEIIAEAGKSRTVTIATNMAGRGTDIKLTPETRAAGGLAIVGTERHESRRVDRQLRGRAGRQGDPGTSQFFVSLEDDLMRLFGSDRITSIMDRLGLKEGEVIQHPMISKSIERAQKKVEENNFGIRKRLLEYDDVMNSQREVVYRRRRHALFGERISLDIANMMFDLCDYFVDVHYGSSDYQDMTLELIRILSVEPPFTEEEYYKLPETELRDKLYNLLLETYKRKSQAMAAQAYPVIKQVYETQGGVYENIVVPITDGLKAFHVLVNLKKAYESKGAEVVKSFEKTAILMTIDDAWREHLREMDDLKQSVQNAAYEQKDPLLIYKLESFNLFKEMIEGINRDVISLLMKGYIPVQDPGNVQRAQAPRRTDLSQLRTQKSDIGSSLRQPSAMPPGGRMPAGNMPQEPRPQQPVKVEKKVGRNDPCPCGSGKKYKNCHGAGLS